MIGEEQGPGHRAEEWERSERRSFQIALGIALMPIPVALLISWALGDPPWRARPDRDGRQVAPSGPGHPPGPPTGHEPP